MTKIELDKVYDARKVEDKIYKKWEKSGFFNPDNLKCQGKPFVISMPPPNATGVLHTGHATMLAIQDLMIRYHRLKGEKTLWLPGADHAAIATQTKVEKDIAKEGLTRQKLGRERFLRRVGEFVENSRATIKKQIRKMGSSCDWSRERFTLDKGLSEAVKTAFVRMHQDGLIYRGARVVNWCPRCHSTLADDEIEYLAQKAKFYTFKYNKNFPFAIATTRPETKLGDTAVAVNPRDKRYQKYIGQTFKFDFCGIPLTVKVIADRQVDQNFGTGALGVTPAHSQIDYQMALENNLAIIKVIDEDGNICPGFGRYSGKLAAKAGEMIIQEIKKRGLIIKEEELDNNLSICYRCGAAIEPLPSKQWFVAVDKPFKLKNSKKLGWPKETATLKELAIQAVKSGRIKIIPQKFEKVYFHWLENLRDWCISRQIWYGHQLPVWYRSVDRRPSTVDQQKEIYVGIGAPKGDDWIQDEDTLDTWFSSALWTFSTLGWPEKTKDLKDFHPTSVMETGYDILFFWVARMIIMSVYCLNDVPFKTVYLHGLVRDEKGVKMSKSLDNAIDPLEMIKKYGTDALRLSMLIGVTPGNDFKLYDERIAGYRNFINKLWNISRFVLQSVDQTKIIGQLPKAKSLADTWILAKLGETAEAVSKDLDGFQFSAAGEKLQDFTWNDFADWYIEVAKIEKNKDNILLYVLQNILKLWHPFCPFVTENVWQRFRSGGLLMADDWPDFKIKKADDNFEKIKNLITAIRVLRAENKIEPAKLVDATIISKNSRQLIASQAEIIKKLARCGKLEVLAKGRKPNGSIGAVAPGREIYLSLSGIINRAAEKARLRKEIAEIENYINNIKIKLSNKEFVSKAPKDIVAKEKDKLKAQREKLEKLASQLNNLK